MGSLRFVFCAIQMAVLLVLANCGRAQTIGDVWTRSLTLYPIDATDFSNTITLQLANNTAGGLTWTYPGSNGSPGQMLITDGSGNWSYSTPLDGSTFLLLSNATTGRNIMQPANSSSVNVSLKAFGSGSSDLLDLLNSSGSTIGFIAHDASAHFPAITNTSQGAGAVVSDATGTMTATNAGAGTVLTSNGVLSAPTFQAISAGTVTSVDGSGGTTGLTLTGGPITTSGTLTLGGTLAVADGGTGTATTSQNFAFIGPTSGSGAPSFRALVAGDLPSLTGSYVRTAPTASTDNVVQGTASGVIPFIVKQHSTATDDLTEWQDNTGAPVASIQSDGTSLFSTVFVTNSTTIDGDLSVGVGGSHRGQVLLMNATGGNATRLQAANGAAAVTYTLPSTDGSSGNALLTNGSGILSWGSGGGSGTVTSISDDGSHSLVNLPITTSGTMGLNYSNDNAWLINQDFEASTNAVNTYQDGVSLFEQYVSDATHTQKISPLLSLTSQVWNTTATAANNFVKFQIANVPTSGASPSAILEFKAGVGTTSGPTLTQLATLKTNGLFTHNFPSLTTTTTSGVILDEATASTGGTAVRYSPALELKSHVWNTSADATYSYFIDVEPTSAASPTGALVFKRNDGIEEARVTSTGEVDPVLGFLINHSAGTSGQTIVSNGTRGVWGSVSATNITSGTLAVANGGTGSGSPTANGIFCNQGGSTAYQALALGTTAHFTGALGVANGGLGLTTFTAAGRIPYSTAATSMSTLANPGSTWGLLYYDVTNTKPAWANGLYFESGSLSNLDFDGTNIKFISGGGNKINMVGGGVGDATIGTATLSSGSVTVSTSAVTSSCVIFLTYSGTAANKGFLDVENIVGSTSFDIKSTNASDGNSVNWVIFDSH